jgi:VWFA-related protein
MLRTTLVAATLLISTVSVLGRQPSPQFTANSKLVVVPAVVVDAKGAAVSGLTHQDFQVFEDGKPVMIDAFVPANPTGAPTDGGRFIVLVLDNISRRPELAQRTREIAKRLTSRMTPADSIAAIPARGGRWSGPTTRVAAEAAIDRFKPAFGDTIRTAAEDSDDGLKAIEALTEQLAQVPHRRKVMVFIGDGEMFGPRGLSPFADPNGDASPDPFLGPAWFEAIRATARNNFTIYVIDPRGHNPDIGLTQGASALRDAERLARLEYAESFAHDTGGEAWVNTNDYDAAAGRIWTESGNYYLLGYTLPKDDKKVHKIEVRVAKPGVTVRARRARG